MDIKDSQGEILCSVSRLLGADLRNAWLPGADLTQRNLQGADLVCAHLEGADLRGA
ncbi:pentapeptide repeat-containing protein, partial [Candidatus Cyanaurora vandensis]